MFRRRSRRRAAVRTAVVRTAVTEPLEPRTMLTAYVVDTGADVPQSEIDAGTLAVDGKISLREAIEAINRQETVGDAPAGDGDDRIYFGREARRERVAIETGPLSIRRGMSIFGGEKLQTIHVPSFGNLLLDIRTDEPVKLVRLQVGGRSSRVGRLAEIHAGSDVQFEQLRTSGSTQAPAFNVDRASLTITNSELSPRILGAEVGQSVSIEATRSLVRIVGTSIRHDQPRPFGFGELPGGTIRSDGGRVFVRDTEIQDGRGGAVVSRDADVVLRDAAVVDHSRSVRGAIHQNGGRLTIERSGVSRNNSDIEGGGVAAYNASVRIDRSGFLQNTSPTAGGFYAEDSTVRVANTEFLGNVARHGSGGGLKTFRGGTRLDTVVLRDNVAESWGGGLFGRGRVYATDVRIENNVAAIGGGAVFDTDVARLAGRSVVRGNTADEHGGLLFWSGTTVLDGVTIGGSRESDANAAGEEGGGIGVVSSPWGGRPVVSARGLVVAGNSASYGAGVFVEHGTLNLNDSDIARNTAGHAGGGVFSVRSHLRLEDVRIRQNSASREDVREPFRDVPDQAAAGGGIATYQSSVRVEGGDVIGNVAFAGGGLSLRDSEARVSRTVVAANTATGDGGGTWAVDSNLTIRGSVLRDNTAGRYGGAIAQAARPRQGDLTQPRNLVRLDRVTLRGNDAASGGGLWTQATAAIAASRVESNHAAGDGGGLASAGGDLRVDRGTRLTGNVAGGNGGGVFAGGGTLTVDAAQVGGEGGLGNRAARGGGVFAADATTRVSASRLIGNTADADGGGMTTSGGAAAVADSRIASNIAQHGGGLSVVDRAEVRLSATVEGNVAARFGGGLHVSGGGELLIRDTTVRHNLARVGGGLHVGGPDSPMGPGVVRFLRGESAVTGNLASERAGGVALHGEITLRDVRLSGNTSPEDDDLFAGIDAVLNDLR